MTMNQYKEINDALKLISTAENRWDYEEKQGPLWDCAQRYPVEMIDTFYKNPESQFSIAWCLAHNKNGILKNFFIAESKNKNQYIRWCAIIFLKQYKSKDLIDIFVKALKDRSSLVKGEALEAVKTIKDYRIEKVLKHLLTLKSFKNNSPGYYETAKKILQKYLII